MLPTASHNRSPEDADEPYQFHRKPDPPPPESASEKAARVKKAREDDELRRQKEAAAKKARAALLAEEEAEAKREAARKKAEKKKKATASQQKAAKAASQKAEDRKAARSKKRIEVFAAARSGNFHAVKNAIWEDEVDASGPENEASKNRDTLLHLAAKQSSEVEVAWLLDHGESQLDLYLVMYKPAYDYRRAA